MEGEGARDAGAQEGHEAPDGGYTAGGLPLPRVSEFNSDTAFLRRFWKNTNRSQVGPADCWEWTAYREEKGYGCVRVKNGAGVWLTCAAHRVSFALANGRWPAASLMVLHSCDNPACVNPAHLSEGTAAENSEDMKRKGRHRNGADHWRGGRPSEAILRGGSPLSECDVREIRARVRDAAPGQIAAEFGVTPETVRAAAAGKRFAWVAGSGGDS